MQPVKVMQAAAMALLALAGVLVLVTIVVDVLDWSADRHDEQRLGQEDSDCKEAA